MTSGATEVACTQPPPANAQAALSAEPDMPGAHLPYREAITHQAFERTLNASGVFLVTDDKTVLRRQVVPKREELEIGPDWITVRRNGTKEQRPIPKKIQPLLRLLRAIVLGGQKKIDTALVGALEIDDYGWRLPVSPQLGQTQQIILVGCGAELLGIDLIISNTQSRTIRFGDN